MDNLPSLLLNEILFRLDRRDMAIMRCTNKYLRGHMSEDPYFEKEYRSILFPISNDNLSFGNFKLQPKFHIMGCCSGLLLLFVEKLFVVNPLTRKYRLVNYTCSRVLAKLFSRGVVDPARVGFAVDEINPSTQRFKIVCLIEVKEEEAKTMYQFEVSREDSFWRLSKTSITCHSSDLVKGTRPVYLDQVLFWLRNDGSIVTFNTVTEKAQLLQTRLPYSKSLFWAAPADIGLTLLAATEEVIFVYALNNNTEWVLVRRILNDQKKRIMSWKVAAYDGKFLVLTEAVKDVTVIHEYDLRTNNWRIVKRIRIWDNHDRFFGVQDKKEFFQLRPSSSSVIGVNYEIGIHNLLLRIQPQNYTPINHLSLFLKDIFTPETRPFDESNAAYIKVD
ncbi:unnamed protein product [Microthlaspi erraticum]|uniref:F-box domain-containing protein n=1 Tax=Microthlaspi erraticum TaxID=1685480 RepID=A0A6D2L6X6_9BRAS|nr:unnamed protein product [Microthlaspi erraticum]